MVDSALPVGKLPAQTVAPRRFSALLPRLMAGAVILLTWETVVRLFAPRFVAKPSTIVTAIPQVLADPTFLKAAAQTLAAVAEGLAIALVCGTVVGLMLGRSMMVQR